MRTGMALAWTLCLAAGATRPARAAEPTDRLAQELASGDRNRVTAAAQAADALAGRSGAAELQPLAAKLIEACAKQPEVEGLWRLLPALDCPRDPAAQKLLAALFEAEAKRPAHYGALLKLVATLGEEGKSFWPQLTWALQQPGAAGYRESALVALIRIGPPAAGTFGQAVAGLIATEKDYAVALDAAILRMGGTPTRTLPEAMNVKWSSEAHACVVALILEERGRDLLLHKDNRMQLIGWHWVTRLIESAVRGLPTNTQPVIRDPRGYLLGKAAALRALADEVRKKAPEDVKQRVEAALAQLGEFERKVKGEGPGPEPARPAKPPAKPEPAGDPDF